MKRYASHYLCYQEEELSEEVQLIIHRDSKELQSIPASILSTHPAGTKGFYFCCVEVTAEGNLSRLFPFTEEIESTEWHPGTLHLKDLLSKELF